MSLSLFNDNLNFNKLKIKFLTICLILLNQKRRFFESLDLGKYLLI